MLNKFGKEIFGYFNNTALPNTGDSLTGNTVSIEEFTGVSAIMKLSAPAGDFNGQAVLEVANESPDGTAYVWYPLLTEPINNGTFASTNSGIAMFHATCLFKYFRIRIQHSSGANGGTISTSVYCKPL